MSDLRIGQRCRLVNVKDSPNPEWHGCEGDEVTILGLPGSCLEWPDQYEVTMPAHYPRGCCEYFTRREYLRPLTDPGADAFMERIRKLGREPIIEVEMARAFRSVGREADAKAAESAAAKCREPRNGRP